jgi:hypothetical protein
MPQTFFAPKPGRFGVQPVPLNSGRLNTGTLAAGTQTHNIGGLPTKCYINKATLCAETFPTAATSCAVTLFKMTGATAVALTSALDINTKTADVPLQFSFLTTLTDAQRTLTNADSLRVSIVTVGVVSAQPDDITITAELLALE